MAVTTWLIDKSAYVRLQLGQVPNCDEWSARISRGLRRPASVPHAGRVPQPGHRGPGAGGAVADRARHRAPSIPDLLIAATAEKAGLTVLAADKDFNLIDAITGQAIRTLTN